MPRRDHRTRAFLFLAAVLLPSAVLVGTTLRLIGQERELASRRWEEERSLLALRLGQELLNDLRQLEERTGRVSSEPAEIFRVIDSDPAIVALAIRRDDDLLFPWELRPSTEAEGDPELLSRYRRLLQDGERAEYREGRLREAARWYGDAAGLYSQGGRLQAEALVNQARTLLRSEQSAEARDVFLRLAELPALLSDEEEMPFAIYGLEGLYRLGVQAESLVPHLVRFASERKHASAPALIAYLQLGERILESAEDIGELDLLQEAGDSVAARLATLQALEELRSDLPALRGAAPGRDEPEIGPGDAAESPAGGGSWMSYGEEPWLVGVRNRGETSPTLVMVVRPGLFLARGEGYSPDVAEAARRATLLPANDLDGEPLGQSLPELRVTFPPDLPSPVEEGTVEGWFFRLFLPLILLLTAFAAYLAWREVQRETEASRLRSQFVSSVTHELKTPLTSIRMFAETLRLGRSAGPEAQEEYLETIVHETERLSRLINNVLDFARIERGEKSYHLSPTALGGVVQEAARAVSYPMAQDGFALKVDVAEDLPMVEADGDALIQALLNLLSNAMKFSGESREIDLRVRQEDSDILLQVSDRGRGIPPEDREAIFEDFYRTADAEADGIPGTGLGLSLVAHVAQAHGGRVQVESEVDRGSTFTLRIPLEPEGTPAVAGSGKENPQ